jgi:hypothetical protein
LTTTLLALDHEMIQTLAGISLGIGEEFLERLPRSIAANRDAERATTALERKWLASSPLVEAEIAGWFDAEHLKTKQLLHLG